MDANTTTAATARTVTIEVADVPTQTLGTGYVVRVDGRDASHIYFDRDAAADLATRKADGYHLADYVVTLRA